MSSLPQQAKQQARRWGPAMLAGAIGGLAASVPMALAMMGLERWLPGKDSILIEAGPALPPKQITARTARRAGVEEIISPGRDWEPATWLAHLGYGAATASLYPLLTRWLPAPAALRGMVFALGVWATSYLGWLPAADILPPATRQPARRNTVMILSHLLWGALLSLIVRLMMKGER